MSSQISNERPAPDKVITDIADYALGYEIKSDLAYETARYCLMDTLGCGLEALEYPACTKLLGPIVPGTVVPHGARVPGTSYQLDPVQAAFNIGAMIRWLDLQRHVAGGGVGTSFRQSGRDSGDRGLAVAMPLRTAAAPLQMRHVLTAMIKAHEIQGCIALENSFNKVGLDHVVLVKVASTAVVCQLLGLTREQTVECDFAGMGGWAEPAHVSPRSEYGIAQKLGGGRCDEPRGATGADGASGRDGLSVGADGEDVGILRRFVQGAGVQIPAAVMAAT